MNKSSKLILIFLTCLSLLLRLPFLDRFPPALYSDEVSQGYNAYSILKTGKDEYGTFLPVALRSFGDWKPPLQTYLMIPTIALFGLNAWGVRLPSAVLGALTIPLVYCLILIILEQLATSKGFITKNKYKVAFLSAFWLVISPWHILQSRAAMLVGISLFFLCLALWFFIKGFTSPKVFYLSSIFFGVTIYGYYGMRLVVLLLLLTLFILFANQFWARRRELLISLVLLIVTSLPLIISFWHEPNVLFGRVKTVSIFYDQGIPAQNTERIKEDGILMSEYLANFFHYTPYSYLVDIERRFFEHFSGTFLFSVGDKHPPFQIPQMGVLYYFDLLFLSLGIYSLLKYERRLFWFLAILMIISILPAALTFVTPSANRSFTLVLPFSLVVGIGISFFLDKTKNFVATKIVIGLVYAFSFTFFLYQYAYVLPTFHADWWHAGYKELFTYLRQHQDKYEQITVSGKASVPYIFYLFYTQVDPNSLKGQIERNYKDDEFGFEHVDSFGIYNFPRRSSWDIDKTNLPRHSLLVLSTSESPFPGTLEVTTIVYPNRQIAFKIYEKD